MMVCTPPSVGGSTAAGARVLLQAAAAAAAGVRLSDGEREWRQAAQGETTSAPQQEKRQWRKRNKPVIVAY